MSIRERLSGNEAAATAMKQIVCILDSHRIESTVAVGSTDGKMSGISPEDILQLILRCILFQVIDYLLFHLGF